MNKNSRGLGEIDDLEESDEIKLLEYPLIGLGSIDYEGYNDPKDIFKAVFEDALNIIQELNEIEIINNTLNRNHKNLLFSSIITSLEAYLSDTYIFHVSRNSDYMQRYVKTQYKRKTS